MTNTKESRTARCTTDSYEFWSIPATIRTTYTFCHRMEAGTAVGPIHADEPVLVIAERSCNVALGLDYAIAVDESA
jgi:hypothetical protein